MPHRLKRKSASSSTWVKRPRLLPPFTSPTPPVSIDDFFELFCSPLQTIMASYLSERTHLDFITLAEAHRTARLKRNKNVSKQRKASYSEHQGWSTLTLELGSCTCHKVSEIPVSCDMLKQYQLHSVHISQIRVYVKDLTPNAIDHLMTWNTLLPSPQLKFHIVLPCSSHASLPNDLALVAGIVKPRLRKCTSTSSSHPRIESWMYNASLFWNYLSFISVLNLFDRQRDFMHALCTGPQHFPRLRVWRLHVEKAPTGAPPAQAFLSLHTMWLKGPWRLLYMHLKVLAPSMPNLLHLFLEPTDSLPIKQNETFISARLEQEKKIRALFPKLIELGNGTAPIVPYLSCRMYGALKKKDTYSVSNKRDLGD